MIKNFLYKNAAAIFCYGVVILIFGMIVALNELGILIVKM